MSEIQVTGLSELQKFLGQLPAKMEKNVMRGALRAGMAVVKPSAQRKVHSVSGELAKGLKITTRARGGQVVAALRTTGPHAFVAKFVEYGTAAHFINAGRLGGLKLPFGIFASVFHPGSEPKPFMRPALDSNAGRAVVAAAEYIKKRLATKEGLDTAGIDIEVKE